MTQDTDATPRAPSAGWRVVGVLGEILITVGVLLLLYVGYQLWWTNVEAGRAADSAASQLKEAWQRPPQGQGGEGAPEQEEYVEPEFGEAFALMYIPRLANSVWGTPVVEGIQPVQLAKGLGHYPGTAMPGEVGNFAVAGHRATNGEPFRAIDLLKEGDEVYVETRDDWFVYTLEKDQIVTPQDVWVVDPVPGRAGVTPTERLITLTTCHPRWGSVTRWIWWGTLTDKIDKDSGEVPEAILAGA